MQFSAGKRLPSPKSKLPPPLQIHPEEQSPKRMFNGQSTESLESLSDELASNSGGNNTSTNNRDAVSRRVSFLPPTTSHRINSFSHEISHQHLILPHYEQFPSHSLINLMLSFSSCSRHTSTTATSDVEPCTTARLTTKMSLVSRRVTSSSSSPRRQRTTTGWRGSSSQSPTVVDSSPPPLSTCYQTDHQPCRGTSEELTREDNQERQSPCPAVCVIPPTPPVCASRNGESGRWTHQPRRPTDPSYPTSRDPSPIPCHLASRPSCRTHHHHLGPAWPPDHQVPPESLKQGQELAIPTSAAVAVSTPVMTLALVLVRQKPGG